MSTDTFTMYGNSTFIKIYGKRVLIYGDLHLSDTYKGKHKNYLKNCFSVMGSIERQARDMKPDVIIFLGDIVGLREKKIKNRIVLLHICKFFINLNTITGGKVYALRGNHDIGDGSDYDFLTGLGYLKTSASCGGVIDFYGSDTELPEVRFHLVDYGLEKEPIPILDGTYNVVLCHNNMTIEGVTNWYAEHNGIPLAGQSNWQGANLVIAGHIHNPSPQLVSTRINGEGEPVNLLYVGCPTRPSADQKYQAVHIADFSYDMVTGDTTWDADTFELDPLEEVFDEPENISSENIDDSEVELDEERKKALKDVLTEIMDCRLTHGNLLEQIRLIPNASEEAKKLACSYLQVAIDNKNNV